MQLDLYSSLVTRLAILKELFTEPQISADEALLNQILQAFLKSGKQLVDNPEGEKFLSLFDLLVAQILLNNYPEVKKLYYCLRASPQCGTVKDIIDKAILYERGMELTNHGCTHSFRFWSADKKTAYLAFGNEVIKFLRSKSLEACYGFGTALGLQRDGKLIDHDDDIDIIVASPQGQFEYISSMRDYLAHILQKAGYSIVLKSNLAHIHVAFDPETKIDIFAGMIEGDYFSCCPAPRRLIRYDEVFPAVTRTFFGLDCPFPRQPEAYLAKCYGADWQTPTSVWRYNWDTLRRDYQDILQAG